MGYIADNYPIKKNGKQYFYFVTILVDVIGDTEVMNNSNGISMIKKKEVTFTTLNYKRNLILKCNEIPSQRNSTNMIRISAIRYLIHLEKSLLDYYQIDSCLFLIYTIVQLCWKIEVITSFFF